MVVPKAPAALVGVIDFASVVVLVGAGRGDAVLESSSSRSGCDLAWLGPGDFSATCGDQLSAAMLGVLVLSCLFLLMMRPISSSDC